MSSGWEWTYHCFPTDGLHEAIKYLRKCVCTNLRPADLTGIPIHAFLPILTVYLHGGNPHVSGATIFGVIHRTLGHLSDYEASCVLRCFIYVCPDSEKETPDEI